MADITITSATRANIYTAQRIDALSAWTNRRLATGQRVNKPSDNPTVYFKAKALTNQASDLMGVKSDIGQSLSIVGSAVSSVGSMTQLINQMMATTNSATDQSAAARAEQAAQFDDLRAQLDGLAADAQYAGVNLLGATPDNHNVALNADGSSSMTISGVASDSAGLGIGTAAGTYNNFATDADVEAALNGLEQAVRNLRGTAKTLGSNASTLTTRLDYTQALASKFESGAYRLTGSDINEEAANMLALNVARQLALAGMNFVNQSQIAILQLI